MTKPMKDYVPLQKVGNGNIKRKKLSTKELKERSLSKLDSKLFFLKKKLNGLALKVNEPKQYEIIDYELIVIQYEANYREYQVLEYIYKKINN